MRERQSKADAQPGQRRFGRDSLARPAFIFGAGRRLDPVVVKDAHLRMLLLWVGGVASGQRGTVNPWSGAIPALSGVFPRPRRLTGRGFGTVRRVFAPGGSGRTGWVGTSDDMGLAPLIDRRWENRVAMWATYEPIRPTFS